MSFKIDMEATASNKDKFSIPEELMEAHFVLLGITHWPRYHLMPKHLIEEILFLRQLESINSERNK